jgi:hypothetical protein
VENEVKSLERKESLHGISDVLKRVRVKGVRLWSANGQLRYKAPKGVLSEQEVEELRSVKDQIVAVLEETRETAATEPRLESRQRSYSAPLAFSQLAYWNVYQLKEQRSQWFPASATRLRGPLNVQALEMSFAETIRLHDALRTRLVISEGILQQQIVFPGDCAIQVDDLTHLPESLRETEMYRLTKEIVSEPTDVLSGPLIRVRLIRLTEDDHVLVLALEHMVSDGASMNILLQDLFLAYEQAEQDRAVALAEVPIQFADYAFRQQTTLNSWIKKHGAYWDKRLAGCQRLRFPEDKKLPASTCSGMGEVRVTIDGKLKAELREWSRQRRTTIVMSIFTAYVGLVLRWCDVSEAVVLYQIDGRIAPELERTIGFLASVLYLRVGFSQNDSFIMLLDRVIEEYCNAYEHADFSYIAAQVPTPAFVRNSCFNWRPKISSPGQLNLDGSQEVITRSQMVIDRQIDCSDVDIDPMIALVDAEEGIDVAVEFPRKRFSNETMERFGRTFLMFIVALVRNPEQRVKGVPLL